MDLHTLPDDELAGEPVLQSTLTLLKYSRSKQLVEKLSEILRLVLQSLPQQLLPDWIDAIGAYVMAVNKNLSIDQYKQTLSSVLPTQYAPGSLADRLLTQGRQEGRQEGREEGQMQGMLVGKIQVLQDLLGAPVMDNDHLLMMDHDSLAALLTELQLQLRDRPQ